MPGDPRSGADNARHHQIDAEEQETRRYDDRTREEEKRTRHYRSHGLNPAEHAEFPVEILKPARNRT